MPLLIERQLVSDDSWVIVDSAEGLSQAGDLIVDWALWQAHSEPLAQHSGRLGVLVEGDVELDALADLLPKLALVAIRFPSFADGRGFSFARLLRDKHGFSGQIRAVGEVSWDRLRYMARCGFDAFDIPSERYSDAMLGAFDEISVCYQGAADDPRPLFKRA